MNLYHVRGNDLEEWKVSVDEILKRLKVSKQTFAYRMGVSRQAYYWWKGSDHVDLTVFLASLVVLSTMMIEHNAREKCPEVYNMFSDLAKIYWRTLRDSNNDSNEESNSGKDGTDE